MHRSLNPGLSRFIRVWLLPALVGAYGLAASGNAHSAAADQDRPVLQIWPDAAPLGGSTQPEGRNLQADQPTLTVYRATADEPNLAIVVCPGGGYGGLAVDHEGKQIGEWLNRLGITAFVLRYPGRPLPTSGSATRCAAGLAHGTGAGRRIRC